MSNRMPGKETSENCNKGEIKGNVKNRSDLAKNLSIGQNVEPIAAQASCTSPKRPDKTDSKPLTPLEVSSTKPFNEATSDAKPIDEDLTIDPSLKVPEGATSLYADDDRYDMSHQLQGRVVIFNHYDITGMEKRDGTDKDVERLTKTFEKLKFDVKVFHDLTLSDVNAQLDNLKLVDYSEHNCLVIIILTHGTRNGFLMAKDAPYMLETVWQRFTGDKCTTLAGKPKLFFIQACRGDQYDKGVNVRRTSKTQTDSSNVTASYKIPSYTDILIGQSTFEEFASWRNIDHGSWYIQCLCEVLDTQSNDEDLLSMLTTVARKVATEHRSLNDNPYENDMVQTTTFMSTLMRKVYLKAK